MSYPNSRQDREVNKFVNIGTGSSYSATQDETASKVLIFGATESGTGKPLRVNPDGELNVNLETSDIEIGAVEIKDGNSDNRAEVDSSGNLNIITHAGTANIVSIKPGTGVDNLGKQEDEPHSSADVGVMMLGVRNDGHTDLTDADGDYVPISVDGHAGVHTTPEHQTDIDDLEATTGWTVLGDDTDNLTTSTNHILGTASVSFDKVNGSDDTVFAGIQKTISSKDLSIYHIHETIHIALNLSSLSSVDYFFLRLGTDSSNYNEWRIQDDDMGTGWQVLKMTIGNSTGSTGNGWDPSAITYTAVGVAFDNQTNTLANILVNHFSIHSSQHTVADIVSEVSTAVNTPNVRLNGYGGSTDTNIGNASANTLRTVIASDQPDLDVIVQTGTVNTTISEIENINSLQTGTVIAQQGAGAVYDVEVQTGTVTVGDITNISYVHNGTVNAQQVSGEVFDVEVQTGTIAVTQSTDPFNVNVETGTVISEQQSGDVWDVEVQTGTVKATQSGTWDIVSNSSNIATESTLTSIDGNIIKADTDKIIVQTGTISEILNLQTGTVISEQESGDVWDTEVHTGTINAQQISGNVWDTEIHTGTVNVQQIAGEVWDSEIQTGTIISTGSAMDYHPDTDAEQGQAEGSPRWIATNLKGEQIDGVNPRYNVLDNISTTYDADPTTAVSTAIECWNYRHASLSFELDKATTPTDILIEVEVSLDGTNFTKLTIPGWLGDLRYDDTAVGTGIEECVSFPIACQKIRVRVTATGTDATKTFTVANATLYLRN